MLLLVCVSPWAFGAVEAEFEFVLFVGVAGLLLLWGVRCVLAGRFRWAKCPIALCLAALFVVGVFQALPLPHEILRVLSPAAARFYENLLPEQPEVLPFELARFTVSPPAGSTISLYPGITRRELMRLLAVFLLFATVRNNLSSPRMLIRLSLAVVCNGVLLSYLGLAQFFSSSPNRVYWNLDSPGTVFGPFINRNHFAFYMNMCVGLGIGLLLFNYSKIMVHTEDHSRHRHDGDRSKSSEVWWSRVISNLLGNPKTLWISAAIGFMVASSVLCLSRGGFLALLGAVFTSVSLGIWRSPRFARLEVVLIVATMAIGLLAWFGLDQVRLRLGTIWSGQAFEEGRRDLWWDTLRMAAQFPLLGTGYGTFQFVEPLYRTDSSFILNEHAHNEYLEAASEGGLVRLAITVIGIWLVICRGTRALQRFRGIPTAGLVLGAVLAFFTLVFHSVAEFGVHVPAITLLATVFVAQLCALGGSPEQPDQAEKSRAAGTEPETEFVIHGRWFGGLIALLLAAMLGFTLVGQGWKAACAQLYLRFARIHAMNEDEAGADKELAYLQAAAGVAPDFARIQIQLARKHLDVYEAETELLEQNSQGDAEAELADKQEQAMRAHLVPALRHYLVARDLCPLLGQPHLQLAAHVESLAQTDPRSMYFDRAKFLMPNDSELWFMFGLQELVEGNQEQAWKSWRRSLELSDLYFSEILKHCEAVIKADGLLQHVLPDNPELLLRAAEQLFPLPEQTASRSPFLQQALALIQRQNKDNLDADQIHIAALLYRTLDNRTEAVEQYQAALRIRPMQIEWRYELAEVLYELDRLRDSHRELVTILHHQPEHAKARKLYDIVFRRMD